MKVSLCVLFVLAIIAIDDVVINCVGDQEWVCQQNVSYKENECNECTCNKNHQLLCGDKGCLDPLESKLFNCEVGTTSMRDCNQCWCIKDIGTVCTNRQC